MTEIKRILGTDPDSQLNDIFKVTQDNKIVWKAGYYKNQQLHFAHIVAQKTIANVEANPQLSVALENLCPVGDRFHLKTYGHVEEALTGYGAEYSQAGKNALKLMADTVPVRPRAIPISKGERGFFVTPLETAGRVIRFGLRWLGPATDVLAYALDLNDAYSEMSNVAKLRAKEYAMLELIATFPNSSFVPIEGYPLYLDVTEHVLYEFEIGIWRPDDVGAVVKSIELTGYAPESQVHYSETIAAFKDEDGKWRLALRHEGDDDERIAIYTSQKDKIQ